MELKHYATLLWRWLWLIVLGTALAGAAAFGVSYYSVPVYEASTTLLINQAPASSATPDYTSVLTSERLARTYAELIQKRPVYQEVVDNLDLAFGPDALSGKIRVSAVRDTQLIVVTVEDTSPQRAAAIANELVTVFGQQNRGLQASRYATSKESLQTEIDKIQAEMDRTQSELDALAPQTRTNLDERERLQSLLAQHRGSYTTLLESLEEVRLAEAQTTDSISVVEEAVPETTPVRPRTLLNTLLGAIVGGMLALGVVFLIEYLDDSVKSREEVEAISGAATLAAIVPIRGKELPDKLITARHGRSPITEAYRLLRTNIEFSSIGNPCRTLLVTSSGPGEGKSTTVANLAIVLAQTGKRVILVDTDLRRPTLHKFFQRTNLRGFTTALLQQGDVTLNDCIVPTSVANLRLMTSGPLPPNPAELLVSPRMAELVEELKAQADVVLFDSPPLLAVTDATLLARISDGTLLVVLTAETRTSALRRACEQLAQSGTRLLGVVMNRVSSGHSGYYYDYRYSYYYYGEEHQRKPNGHTRAPWGLPFTHSKNGNGNGTSETAVATDDSDPVDRP